jgi:ferredoxin
MLQVRKDLCVGCGLCALHCPRSAISIFMGRAEIDQNKCNSCRLCLKICPRGAIVEMVPVSKEELATMVAKLRTQTDDIIRRIERLEAAKSHI